MEEFYSVKGGRIEGVAWMVVKGMRFVVEKRPEHLPGASICIPAGHINLIKDKGKDYIEKAFLRESGEEFASGNFLPEKYSYLGPIKFEEEDGKGGIRRLLLHYYAVTGWNGKVPSCTVEHGMRHSSLLWFSLAGFKRLPQSCDREAIMLMIKNNERIAKI